MTPTADCSRLRVGLIANVASRLLAAVVGLVMVPVYLHWLGRESYGLIGFQMIVQSCFMLLDVGLTPTFSRQVARHRGGGLSADALWQLLSCLERVFLLVAVLGGAAIMCGAPLIAEHWLQATMLAGDQVVVSVMLIGVYIAVAWQLGLYRALLIGSERLVLVGVTGSLFLLARAVGVLVVFVLVGATPVTFFAWQVAVSLVELLVFAVWAHRAMPVCSGPVARSWAPLRAILGMSGTLAFTGGVWIMTTQLDKLVLSALLPLAEYGVFSLAVVAAGGIPLLASACGGAVQPRLSRLEAAGEHAAFEDLYGRLTQVLAATACPVALVMAWFAEPLVLAWTGDVHLAHEAAPTLRLYALGNGLLALTLPSYLLQVAKGDLRLHVQGSLLMALLLAPLSLIGAWYGGPVGAGWAWVVTNVVYLAIFVPRIHRRFMTLGHGSWLGRHALPPVLAAAAAALVLHQIVPATSSRLHAGMVVAAASVVASGAAAMGSSLLRLELRRLARRLYGDRHG